jgi:hypothetical protein
MIDNEIDSGGVLIEMNVECCVIDMSVIEAQMKPPLAVGSRCKSIFLTVPKLLETTEKKQPRSREQWTGL